MIRVRRASDRGHADHGWLDTHHTFSFADYYDPAHMGFRSLRVMNEDRVSPGAGFGMHGHRDMEIITYVLSGALEHKDSLGHGEVLRPGELQRMSAGTGIRHSEFNPSNSEPTHLYQIWLEPNSTGLPPSYEQRPFAEEGRRGQWQLVASPDAADGSLLIHQDARVLLSVLTAGETLNYDLAPSRHAWLQVLRGAVRLNSEPLQTSDGAAISEESRLTITTDAAAEVLLFDLA
jgi:redox-sensitive bicupin YhaK (pirin superfamily)